MNKAVPYLPILCALSAFCVFCAYILEISSFPGSGLDHYNSKVYMLFFKVTDMASYVAMAEGLLNGSWPREPYYYAPLFAYILAVPLLFSKQMIFIAFFQALIASATVWLTVKCGERLFGLKAGLLAGASLFLYGGYAYFTAVPHSTVSEVFLCTLSFWFLLRWQDKPENFLRAAHYGLAGGLLCLIRPNFMLIVPLAAAILCFLELRKKKDIKNFIISSGISATGFIFALLPVLVWNNMHSDKLILLSTNGAETYRIANSYDSEVRNFVYPEKGLMPVASKEFWIHQFRKAAAYIESYEAPQNEDYQIYRENSTILTLMPLSFGMIIALFIAASVFYGASIARYWPFYLYTYGYATTVIAFFVIGRFRQPIVPLMLILASGMIFGIIKILKNKSAVSKEKTLVYAAISVFIVFYICSFPFKRDYDNSMYLSNAALDCQKALDMDSAVYYIERKLVIQPTAKLMYNLAACRALVGDMPGAYKVMEKISEYTKPDDKYFQQSMLELNTMSQALSDKEAFKNWVLYLRNNKSQHCVFASTLLLINACTDIRLQNGMPVPDYFKEMLKRYQ